MKKSSKKYLVIVSMALLVSVLCGFGGTPVQEVVSKETTGNVKTTSALANTTVAVTKKKSEPKVSADDPNTNKSQVAINANDILKKIDQNRLAGGKIITSKMIVRGRRSDRTIVAKGWQRGTKDSFTEYLAPAREKGVKMLKLDDQLWTYSPQTDRTILISGHLLRQSVMGSDLSYEDMMEDPSLYNTYTATHIGNEKILDRNTAILELTAKKNADVAYVKRKLWVDEERYIVLKENLYAKSGTLLKTYVVQSVMYVSDRWYPKEAIYKDALKTGKGTSLIIEELEFNDNIPDRIFSKGSLRK